MPIEEQIGDPNLDDAYDFWLRSDDSEEYVPSDDSEEYVHSHDSEEYVPHVQDNMSMRQMLQAQYKIKYVQQDVNAKWGVNADYKKAWYARVRALETLHGKWDESYNLLPKTLFAIQQTNPGTIVDIVGVEPNGTPLSVLLLPVQRKRSARMGLHAPFNLSS
nr:uncharacterized protein LOC109167534 [Ipomoea batatas]